MVQIRLPTVVLVCRRDNTRRGGEKGERECLPMKKSQSVIIVTRAGTGQWDWIAWDSSFFHVRASGSCFMLERSGLT